MKGIKEIGKSDFLRILDLMERDACKFERLENKEVASIWQGKRLVLKQRPRHS